VTPAWDADLVRVDEALARRLLAGAGLRPKSVRPLAEGWDRSVWVVDEELVAGFPRRRDVVPMVEREIEFLPRLAPSLPAPVPVPVVVGEPDEEFPWPWYASRFLPGEEAALAALDDDARVAVGLELAAFLRALHTLEPIAALPVDANRRADMGLRVGRVRELLPGLAARGIWTAPPTLEPLLDAALELPPPALDRVVHGDLYPRNFLVHAGHLSGVIDWIDLGLAAPAIDFSWVWSLVPPAARDAVLAAGGGLDAAGRIRAQVLAIFMGCVIADYAASTGHARLGAFAQDALARTFAD
jgi:aminoglycoside phosphotransferase (APT) family kinase protein